MAFALATLGDLKARLGLTTTDTNRDLDLERYLESATLTIERYTGRTFIPNPPLDNQGNDTAPDATLLIDARYQTRLPLPDARTISALSLDGRTVAAGSYQLDTDPLSATSTFIDLNPSPPPYGIGVAPVQAPGLTLTVVGRFGIWPAPADIVDACLAIAARRFHSKAAMWGDAVQMQDGALITYYKQLPAEIQAILDGYRHVVVA